MRCYAPSYFFSLKHGAGYDIAAWLRARVTPPMVPVVESSKARYKVEVVLEGLESPWAIVPMPDGRLFITERPGRLRVVQNRAIRPAPVPGVPRVSYQGQGGLLDMALHPDYASNRFIYLAYTIDSDAGLMTRIARFKETPEGLKEMKVIFPAFPEVTNLNISGAAWFSVWMENCISPWANAAKEEGHRTSWI